MSLSVPAVFVSCDDCGAGEDVELRKTITGYWSARHVTNYLLRTGWGVNDDDGVHYCPACAQRRDARAEDAHV